MTTTARKYNPGFLSDNEIVGSFCVRIGEFDSVMEMLRECSGNSNIHQLVIGPRGSGKTSLLLRVAAELRRDPSLSSRFFPLIFAEESYEVSSTGEFWLECVSRLADQAPRLKNGPDLRRTFDDLRQIQDDRMLADRCLGTLQDFTDRERKRLVPIVENLNMMFRDMADKQAGWRLRQALQTEPRILLLASATSRFQEIDDPKRALYDLFRVLKLDPLTTDQCSILWETVCGQPRPPKTMQALRILTGGNPRLITILARFGGNLSFRELMSDLLTLVDDHTEYFKSHLDVLPSQERRVYLALADLWRPATTREIANRARLDTSKCSAQLARLTERGAVEVHGGTPRRKLYYLTERLYNIYYLLRRSRGPVPLIEALIRFMDAYYSTDELREFGALIASEAMGLDDDELSVYRTAFNRLIELPSLADHREGLLTEAPWMVSDSKLDNRSEQPWTAAAQALFDRALAQMNQGEAEQALATWDEVVSRFDESGTTESPRVVARALISKALLLGDMELPEQSLVICETLLDRFGTTTVPTILNDVAATMACKGMALADLGRHQEAIAVWDELVERFGSSTTPQVLEQVAGALLDKGVLLARLDRLTDALDAWRDLLQRFGERKATAKSMSVAMALANTGNALANLNRPDEALDAWDRMFEGFAASSSLKVQEIVASCLLRKGKMLVLLNQFDAATEVWNDLVHRFATSRSNTLRLTLQQALFERASLEFARGGARPAIATLDFVLEQKIEELSVKVRGLLIRARAHLTEGNRGACVQDVEVALSILPRLEELQKETLDSLCGLAVDLGFQNFRELIRASGAAPLLLPLTTALEKELGLVPRVAKEVEEVAADIQTELHQRLRDSQNPDISPLV